MLSTYEVNTDKVHISTTRSGNAIIQVDKNGKNSMDLFPWEKHNIYKDIINSVINALP